MTQIEKIDYMIQSLELAKEEIKYADKECKIMIALQDNEYYCYGHKGYKKRMPNGTIIRESLKQVGRMANIIANDVVLSPYCHKVFKGDGE